MTREGVSSDSCAAEFAVTWPGWGCLSSPCPIMFSGGGGYISVGFTLVPGELHWIELGLCGVLSVAKIWEVLLENLSQAFTMLLYLISNALHWVLNAVTCLSPEAGSCCVVIFLPKTGSYAWCAFLVYCLAASVVYSSGLQQWANRGEALSTQMSDPREWVCFLGVYPAVFWINLLDVSCNFISQDPVEYVNLLLSPEISCWCVTEQPEG